MINKISVILFLVFLILTNSKLTATQLTENKMDSLSIRFDNTGQKIAIYWISDSVEAKNLIDSEEGHLDEDMSKKFNSHVYRLNNGKVFEIRRLGLNTYRVLYNSAEDLFACRKLTVILKSDKKSLIIVTNYTTEETPKVLSNCVSSPVPSMVEESRRALRLEDGRYLILYKGGQSAMYNSLEDIDYLNPFGEEDLDEDTVIQRSTKMFISPDTSISVVVLPNALAKKRIKNLSSKKEGKSIYYILQDKSILTKYNSEIFLLYKNFDDYSISGRRKMINIHNDSIQFLREIELNIDQLSTLLKLSASQLNRSIESLKILDSSLNNYFFDSNFINQIYNPVAAYVGEVIIKNINGSWELHKNEITTGDKWYPRVKYNQNYIDFIPLLQDELKAQKITGEFSSEAIVKGLLMSK